MLGHRKEDSSHRRNALLNGHRGRAAFRKTEAKNAVKTRDGYSSLLQYSNQWYILLTQITNVKYRNCQKINTS